MTRATKWMVGCAALGLSMTAMATPLGFDYRGSANEAGGSAGVDAGPLNIFTADLSGAQDSSSGAMPALAMWGIGGALPSGTEGGYGYAPLLTGSDDSGGPDFTMKSGSNTQTPAAFVVSTSDTMGRGSLSVGSGAIESFAAFGSGGGGGGGGNGGPLQGRRPPQETGGGGQVSAVPLPTPLALAAVGLVGVVLVRRWL